MTTADRFTVGLMLPDESITDALKVTGPFALAERSKFHLNSAVPSTEDEVP